MTIRRPDDDEPFLEEPEMITGSENQLISNYRDLGPNAQKTLLAIADRLVDGCQYGDFEDGRDYQRDAMEEAIDLAVYQAVEIRKLEYRLALVSPAGETPSPQPSPSRGEGEEPIVTWHVSRDASPETIAALNAVAERLVSDLRDGKVPFVVPPKEQGE